MPTVTPNPSPAQIKAGNYKKKHIRFQGLEISIENPRGSVRSGTDRNGHAWRTRMRWDYGYIRGSKGVDKDHVDCYVGPNADAAIAYVVHQRKAGDWDHFDEDKVMLGFDSEAAAKAAYLAHYDDSRFLGPVTAMPMDEFKRKVLATSERPRMIKTMVLFFKGGTGSGNHDHAGRLGQVGGSQPDAGLRLIEQSLITNAAPWRHIEFSEQAWREEFPGGIVRTPIGKVKMGEAQREKLQERQRKHYFGLIRPTLENPAYIVAELEGKDVLAERIARGEGAERQSVIQFIRVFKDVNGRHHGFMCVTVARDGVEVSVSSSPRKLRRLARAVKEGAILTVGSTLAGETTSPGREDGLAKAVSYHHLSSWDTGSQLGFAVYDFALFRALVGLAATEFLKASATPPGARWITVHPGGKESTGVPVLIQETASGSGAYHVIGGAGGKLNYLKLRGVRSEAEYKQEAAERVAERRAQTKEQAKRDKEAGIYQQKQEAKRAVQGQRQEGQKKFIAQVAESMGWQGHEFDLTPYEGASHGARKRAEREHHRQWLKAAREAVGKHRQWLLADAEARAQALGHDPAGEFGLDVSDLDPVAPQSGLGFSPGYTLAAQSEGGLTDEDIAREKETRRAAAGEEAIQAAEKRRAARESIKAELEALRPDKKEANRAETRLEDPATAARLLRLEKQLGASEKAAREASRQIDRGEEKGAFVVEVGDREVDETLQEDLASDLRTIAARSLLAEIEQDQDYETSLGRHIGVGAYNALQAVSLHAAGSGLLDRRVVDVLGISGASQILSRRLRQDLSPDEITRLQGGLERFHEEQQGPMAEAAVREARAATREAEDIEIGPCATAEDLQVARELNARRIEAIDRGRSALGQALGELEANGALIWALKRGRRDKLEVSMGAVGFEDAMRRAASLGLRRGEYRIATVGASQILEISASGMDRLAKPVDREHLAALQEADAIISGGRDEEDWLPIGVANRPELATAIHPGVAPKLAEKFTPGSDIEQSIKDYIGGRTADGDSAREIVAGLANQETLDRVPEGQKQAFMDALNTLAPTHDAKGKPVQAEAHQERFEQLADEYVQSRFGGRRLPLHRQQITVNQESVDALHQALAEEPAGVAAYKPIGDLAPQDQRALRDIWAQSVAPQDMKAARLRAKLADLDANEPGRYLPDTTEEWIQWSDQARDLFMQAQTARLAGDAEKLEAVMRQQKDHAEREPGDIFSQQGIDPAWQEWKANKDSTAQELNASVINWPRYVQTMGGPSRAYESVQDLVRSKVSKRFAEVYNTKNPGSPLKIGRVGIRHALDHLAAVDPEMRDKRLQENERLRQRDRYGRYAEGTVSDARMEEDAFKQAQMGFFGDEEGEDEKEKPLETDQRHTIGHVAERQIAGMMSVVGRNFNPGQPVKLWNASMSGKNVLGQRAVKLIEANKRLHLALGMGTGKTAIGLSAFTHLHGQGKARKGLFLVPASVSGQFGAEALRYLEPGRYRWHVDPGGSREDRLAAYRDPDTHFVVASHQAFRDDLLHLGAKREGIEPNALSARLDAMTPGQRRTWAKELMEQEGIDPDYLFVDEGHALLDRAGKQNSALANVVDAVSANTPYFVSSSADPVKNDASEAFSLLQHLDPDRYRDRDAFMRQYGVDTLASKEELRREMGRYMITGGVDPGVGVTKREIQVPLNEAQRAGLDEIDRHLGRARVANLEGRVDIEAIKALSPAAFDGKPDSEHEEIARHMQTNVGLLKDAAIRREIDDRGQSAKLDHVASLASERKGRPGVIFAHHRESVKDIAERLRASGHRVVTFTGDMGAKERDAARLAFQPESGQPSADILVASDAGATGLNLQRGQWLVQYDTPQTAMTWRQRQGRIHRQGQKNPVEFIDLVGDHASERAARKRLSEKNELRDALTDPSIGLDDTGLGAYLSRERMEREQGGLF